MIREFSIDEFLFLLSAARWTLLLSAIGLVGGGAAGLFVALLRVSTSKLWRGCARVYIRIFQGTPLLLQLFLLYFGANIFGVNADAWTAAAIGLTLYAGAFLGEIWRGCIEAIPDGQWDGARALALSKLQQLRLVVLPQALRIALPPTAGFAVQAIKSTSLASVIGFVELSRAAQIVNNATFRPLLVYASVAAIYFVMCWPLSFLSQRLERRLGTRHERVLTVAA